VGGCCSPERLQALGHGTPSVGHLAVGANIASTRRLGPRTERLRRRSLPFQQAAKQNKKLSCRRKAARLCELKSKTKVAV